MRRLPGGTVTFLFTDIEGSTRLLHALGPDDYASALAEHRRLVRAAFTAHGGVEVDTQGDAFFVAFADAREALGAAKEAQQALADGPIHVRMGLHSGEPTLTEEGYIGVDVHAGARIAAAAHGGQIVCSRRTKELVDDAFALTDLGEHRLKDLGEPVWIFQLGDGQFPPLKTLSNTNLPALASLFIGRERELEEAAGLLERARVVTILGPGGAGKTRFSIELAARNLDRFPNGVFWVPLATVRDPALVIETAARVLGSKNGLAEHIGVRHMMLLLDNLEQVIDASPRLADLAEACPNLTLLVTSRELMRIRGEHPYALPPLEVDEGVALFTERAGVIASEAVVELCRRLEGLPLAIELAAARATVLTPEQLLGKLRERLDFLRGGRDADPRQRTLRATIEWSYDLLTDEEQRAFARLAVFVGGWTLESAMSVAEVDVDEVQSVEKSLVRRTGDRFWMLETIREFAVEQLDVSSEAAEMRRRHAMFMYELGDSANLTSDSGGVQNHQIVFAEQDNIRAALRWALDQEEVEFGLRLAVAIENFWVTHNALEGARWYERLFECANEIDDGLRARALRDFGGCCDVAGQMDRAKELYGKSLELFRARGDEAGVGNLIHRLAVVALLAGDQKRARKHAEESLTIAQKVGSAWGQAQALNTLGHVARMEGDRERAGELFERVVALDREVGNAWHEAGGMSNLAELMLDDERFDEAEALARPVVEFGERSGDVTSLLFGFIYLARIAVSRGNLSHAGLLWGALEAEQARGPHLWRGWDEERDALTLGHLPFTDPDFERGRAEGRGLTIDRATERALAD